MPPFRQTHDQPVTLQQLRLLEPELLSAEISRLENSIAHLERSNVELRAFARGEGDAEGEALDDDTRREFGDTVNENDETISRQQERIAMIRLALEEQIGVDARNPHYAVSGSGGGGGVQPLAPATRQASEAAPTSRDEDEVMGVAAASTTATTDAPPRTGGVNGAQEGAGDGADDGLYL